MPGDARRRQGPLARVDPRRGPGLFFEPKRIYRAAKGEVPEGDYTVPLGKAAWCARATHVTVVAWGAMLYEALERGQEGRREGRRLRGHRPAHALAARRRHDRSSR
jgi:pyruvate/2-oxoglutarate/acetoin dehydrogenase E1 component